MNSINILIDYLSQKYTSLENTIDGKENIKRYTKPSMASYTENAIALLIDNIKKSKLNYLIDSQLSVCKSKIIRPDIIIYDKNNVIIGIAEIKSQLGYAGNFNVKDYNKKIKMLKEASNKGILSISKINMNFSISDKCKFFIVVLMSSNSHDNLKKLKGTNYFVLFEKEKGKKLWYDNLSAKYINKKEHGYNQFVDFVKKI